MRFEFEGYSDDSLYEVGITNDSLNLAATLFLLMLVVLWLALIVYTYLDARRRISDGTRLTSVAQCARCVLAVNSGGVNEQPPAIGQGADVVGSCGDQGQLHSGS